MTYRPGLMLVLEGIEGAGKSTSATHLHTYLHTKGIGALRTREPGGTPLAEELRNILLREHTEPIDPVAELLMLFASRAQHLAQRIKPALAMSQRVISERFTDATYAYQYGWRGVSEGMIAQLENMVQRGHHSRSRPAGWYAPY